MRAAAPSAGKKSTPSDSDAADGSKESIAATGTFKLLTAAAAVMGSWLAQLPAAGCGLRYAANLFRHGGKLYGPQLFESNPPLLVWL